MNYAPINLSFNLINDNSSNLIPKNNTKHKFIYLNTTDNIHNTQNYNIDYENKLLKSSLSSKNKINKFNTNKNTNKNDLQNVSSFNYKDLGPGRGFGNLNISNNFRNGYNVRNDSKEYREIRESNQTLEHQFQYLNKNFQDPKHIVMSIPRGGEMTRRQIDINNNNFNKKDFNFNY